MGRLAEHVYTDQPAIQHLEGLVANLPTNGHVVLTLKDGSLCDGYVCERPNVQLFRDAAETEGFNGEVRLERPGDTWSRFVWLDEIVNVEHLDSIMGSES